MISWLLFLLYSPAKRSGGNLVHVIMVHWNWKPVQEEKQPWRQLLWYIICRSANCYWYIVHWSAYFIGSHGAGLLLVADYVHSEIVSYLHNAVISLFWLGYFFSFSFSLYSNFIEIFIKCEPLKQKQSSAHWTEGDNNNDYKQQIKSRKAGQTRPTLHRHTHACAHTQTQAHISPGNHCLGNLDHLAGGSVAALCCPACWWSPDVTCGWKIYTALPGQLCLHLSSLCMLAVLSYII